jgi:hypothetical protein
LITEKRRFLFDSHFLVISYFLGGVPEMRRGRRGGGVYAVIGGLTPLRRPRTRSFGALDSG